jgi:hypothetical protein
MTILTLFFKVLLQMILMVVAEKVTLLNQEELEDQVTLDLKLRINGKWMT